MAAALPAVAIDQDSIDAQRAQLRELDQRTQVIKADALTLNRKLDALDREVIGAAGNVLTVFYSVTLNSFVTESVTVKIDGAPITIEQYDYNDAVQLTYGGADRVIRTAVRPGVRTVEVEVAGRYADDNRDAPPVRRSVLHEVGIGNQPVGVEFVLGWTGARRAPKVDVRQWELTGQLAAQPILVTERGTRTSETPASITLRELEYLLETDRLFSALTLLAEENRIKIADSERATARLYEARALLGFGLHDRAEAAFSELAQETLDPEVRNAAVLELAKFEYTRGYYDQAIVTLLRDLREPVTEAHETRRQDLLGRVYMNRGEFDQAVAAFDAAGKRGKLPAYARYNLGITLVREGQLDEGFELLEDVGTMGLPSEEMLALRDKTNLTLAYQYLKQDRYDDAKDAFRRISLRGQYATKGLLGYGWAQYYAAKPDQFDQDYTARPTDIGSLGVLMKPSRANLSLLERLGIGVNDADTAQQNYTEQLRRALVPWSELLGRDQMNHAVQESFLAVPYVLDNLGAHQQALGYYTRGIELLEETRRRIDNAEREVRAGRMIETLIRRDLDSEAGWNWSVTDLPNAPETYYLYNLIASTRFQEALKNYRDLRFVGRVIDGWLRRISAFDSDLAAAARPANPDRTVSDARRNNTGPLFGDIAMDLSMDEQLSAERLRELEKDPEATAQLVRKQLELALAARAPRQLEGVREAPTSSKAQLLRPQLLQLRARTDELVVAQRQLLEDMAVQELDGQRKQAENYLVEARFAVARLYDTNEVSN
ncbi:tetratricopeptide repeat protein [bacterium]|nr:tetratricopeptide repeat protein [bacterium]